MMDAPITAEDLALYAMDLLDGMAAARVELLLRSSSEAREELARIRGDLAAFALSAPQHTPPALTRQRLLKQVAREGRSVPIPVAMQDASPFRIDAARESDVGAPVMRMEKLTAEERRNRVRLPRVMSEPEPIFELPVSRAAAQDGGSVVPDVRLAAPDSRPEPADSRVSNGVRFVPSLAPLPAAQPPAQSVVRRDVLDAEAAEPSDALDPRPSRRPELLARARAASIPEELPEDRYEPSTPFARSAYVTAAESAPARTGNVFGWTGWAAAAALAFGCAFLFYTNVSLNDRVDRQTAALARIGGQVQRADVLMQTLQNPASQRFVLARQDTVPVPAARVAYLPEHGSLVFQASSLEPLAAFKTYELWLIPAGEGRQPIPAGTFKPDSSGYATLVLPSLPKGTVASNFGVTVEDDGGSTAPTLPILLIGQQG